MAKQTRKTPEKSKLQSRPPVVVVLGHVDHGKTTLLDTIRKSHIVDKEFGGITQHIGAYQIEHQGREITFIDTPGHEAFAKMRSRGAKVADLAVLVIAANDGVKPQTKEAIRYIRQADIPFVVAINKIDLPEASTKMVKNQLAENEILVEGYGGDVVCVEISARQNRGIDNLLEMIQLIAEMQELKVDSKGTFEATVIESSLDSKKGPLATLMIKNGSLKIGNQITTSSSVAKVKSLTDEKGAGLESAGPSQPAEVLGFKTVPQVGERVRKVAPHFAPTSLKLRGASRGKKVDEVGKVEKVGEEEEEEKQRIKIVLKADTQGVLEAIETNLPEEVVIIHSDVGQVSESDVLLAQSVGAMIIAFNVKIPKKVAKLAEIEKVLIKTYNIIYKLLEEIEKKVLKILEPTIDEQILGEAEIIAEFKIRGSHIAGCKVKKGGINKKDTLHLKRGDKILADAKIKSLQKERQDVEEVVAGNEAGIVMSPDLDFKIGDVIISYKI